MARDNSSVMATWIEEALADVDKVDDSGKRLPCTAFSLIHKVGTDEDEVHTIKLGLSANAPTYTPTTLADKFMQKARHRARSAAGLQTFNLLAFYDGAATSGARTIFTVMPPQFENGLTTESPTPSGQVQQGMRQNDMCFMQMVRHQNATNEIILGVADRQNAYIRHLEDENRETFLILKDAIRNRQNDQHERDKDLLATERTTKIIEQIAKYGPLVANMLTGRNLFPQNVADTTLVETIAEKFTPEKMMKVFELFSDEPAVGAMLMSRLEAYHKQRAITETAIQKRPAPGATNGEVDAMGGFQ